MAARPVLRATFRPHPRPYPRPGARHRRLPAAFQPPPPGLNLSRSACRQQPPALTQARVWGVAVYATPGDSHHRP